MPHTESLRRHRTTYVSDGLTVLRAVIPVALMEELRRQADRARTLAREERGPQTQALQPVYRYDELDHGVFQEFLALRPLRDAIRAIFDEDREPSDIMGILLEPAHEAWCTNWHRDYQKLTDGDRYADGISDVHSFNQFNAALYDDHSFWYVPGSHARDDTATEVAAFSSYPPPDPALTPQMSSVAREAACLAYARSMPGGESVPLFAGDIALYRNTCWHLGNYVPYIKRATLHDGFYSERDREWVEPMRNELYARAT
jgi:hypothetical protein